MNLSSLVNIPDIEAKLSEFSELSAEHGRDAAILKLSKRYSLPEVSFLADQLQGREAAREKFPSLSGRTDIIYPPSYYLEQTSSEKTARFKASLVSGDLLIDMTGGFGIDTWCFSEKVAETWYVERDAAIYEIAAKNLQLLNPAIKTICADSLEFLSTFSRKADWLYIDPIRRNKDRRLSRIEDFSPNLYEVRDRLFEKSHHVMVKLSPMADITQAIKALNERVKEVYVLSVDNDCKELLLIADGQLDEDVRVISVNWTNKEQRFESLLNESAGISFSDPLNYLYEPNAAIFKAQQYDVLAKKLNLLKLHPNTHLYTSSELLNYPGRVYQVKDILEYKEFKNASSYNIKTRNFPASPAEVAKKLKIKDGGTEFLFCVRLQGGLRLIVCEKITQ